MGYKIIKGDDSFLYQESDHNRATNFRYYTKKQRSEYQRKLDKGKVEEMTCPNSIAFWGFNVPDSECHCPRCIIIRLRDQMDKAGLNEKYQKPL